MRVTVLESLSLKREIEYKPNFHKIINKTFNIEAAVLGHGKSSLDVGFKISVDYHVADTLEKMAEIVTEATCHITGISMPKGHPRMEDLPENVKLLIEGAVGEDILLPMTVAARAARLPGLYPVPYLIQRKGKVGKARKQEAKKKGSARRTPRP